jgi:type IV secretory pathway TrbD component
MEGFNVPIRRSLTQPVLVGGAPREFAILNFTFGAAIVLGLHSLLAIPLFVFIHVWAVYLAKGDPYFLETFKRCINLKDYYDV